MHRTVIQQLLRAVIVIAAAFGALTHPAGTTFLWAVLGALLAIDGPHRPFFAILGLCVVTELAGGLGLGALSVPFAGTALVITGVGRFMMVAPWSPADRWAPAAMVRAWVVAGGSGMLMAGIAALLTVVHGYAIGPAVRAIFRPDVLLDIIGTTVLVLVILRRIDIPFRVRIHFGE